MLFLAAGLTSWKPFLLEAGEVRETPVIAAEVVVLSDRRGARLLRWAKAHARGGGSEGSEFKHVRPDGLVGLASSALGARSTTDLEGRAAARSLCLWWRPSVTRGNSVAPAAFCECSDSNEDY